MFWSQNTCNIQILETINPLHPDISSNILNTILLTFLLVLTRRICLIIRSCLNSWPFPLFSWHLHLIQGGYCQEKLEANHSLGSTSRELHVSKHELPSLAAMFLCFVDPGRLPCDPQRGTHFGTGSPFNGTSQWNILGKPRGGPNETYCQTWADGMDDVRINHEFK